MKSPISRAALGIAALVAIAILANWLISLTPLGNRGADFTENKIHTLSDGTKSILGELDTPVVIRYYASRNSDYMPEQVTLHIRRVDDLLKEYSNLSNGKLRIENLDPEPDTDAEDSANLDGISGQQINGDNLFLGLAVSALDKKVVLPFLDPNEETMLEYQISKAIAEVTTPVKPVIGVMSALDLAGSPAMMPGQPPQQSWVIYQQLQQSFDLKDLGMTPEKIDPDEIKVLLLFHPAGISKETEYLVDQYLLNGGTVVACLDAYSVAAQMVGGGNPMTGQQGAPATSTLPTLLQAWGMKFESNEVLADPVNATMLGGNRNGIAVLSIPQRDMPQKDNIITNALGSVTLYLPGAFKKEGNPGVSINTLMRSSNRAGFVDSLKASRLDPSLDTSVRPEGIAFDLLTHLSGKFKTAFPEGDPRAKEEAEASDEATTAGNEDSDKETSADKKTSDASLKEAVKDGNVFLVADVDAFYDRFAYTVQNFGGVQMATPANGNATLLLNLLDQATGSKYLIGSRSRAATRRPFTVVQEMEAEFNKQVGSKIQEFQVKMDEAQAKLQELQAQKAQGTELYLSPEQEAEIKKFREQQVEYSRLIREQQKDLRRQKDKLAGNITLLNVAAMPTLVVLFGLGLYLKRRSSTRAR
ncbi:Gldg family protein [Luteolibacter algae]|uniref:Gldg family protein n=1 Tax=Luteolibacter algae TaxID=454151 RepID=A0ABW5DB04_9BACT